MNTGSFGKEYEIEQIKAVLNRSVIAICAGAEERNE